MLPHVYSLFLERIRLFPLTPITIPSLPSKIVNFLHCHYSFWIFNPIITITVVLRMDEPELKSEFLILLLLWQCKWYKS